MNQKRRPATSNSQRDYLEAKHRPTSGKAASPRGDVQGTQFVLNVSPVAFDDAEIAVGVLPYIDREQLHELRQSNWSTHVFQRCGTEIIAVPCVVDAPQIGNEARSIRLFENLSIAAALIRNALTNYLYKLPRRIVAYSPLTFLANENLLANAVPDDLACPEWLSISPAFEADIRVFRFDRRPAFVGIGLNVFTKRQIQLTCDRLIEDGFALVGHYVKKKLVRLDPRVEAGAMLVGRVTSIDGDTLHLSDHRQGEESISATASYLEAASFDAVLQHNFKDAADQIKLKLDEEARDFRHGPSRLKRLRDTIAHFNRLSLEMLPGVQVKLESFLEEGSGNTFPAVEKAPPVVYVFDATGKKTDTWHDRGMDAHGPYSTPTFTPMEPRICVVCQRRHRGVVEQFVRKFLDGIAIQASNPHRPRKRQPFTKGFIRKYALRNASVEVFETDGDSSAAYRSAVQRVIETQTERGVPFDLALVEIEERFHQLTRANNPYLVSKAEFMAHQIAVQEFEFETTATPDNRLQYVLNNMALACYAKLGGTPWLVKANLPIAHELVIGLGSAQIGDGRLGQSERIVGITTVFTGEGNYCVSTVSKAVSYDNYEAELLDSLKATIQRLSVSRNWQPKDHVRLVFHSFKPFKHSEEDAVKQLVSGLGDYNVDFAFIHVVEDHPLLLFDENQQGVPAYDGSSGIKGRLAPARGQYLRISGHESLITLTGPTDLKRAADGMPCPVLLRLGRGSTFTDMTYLTRQANTFACHSWRSYFPSPLPVTVMYSELIARILGNLGTVPYWNPSTMLGSIRETCGFL